MHVSCLGEKVCRFCTRYELLVSLPFAKMYGAEFVSSSTGFMYLYM